MFSQNKTKRNHWTANNSTLGLFSTGLHSSWLLQGKTQNQKILTRLLMLWTENMKSVFQDHFASCILMSSPCCANRSFFLSWRAFIEMSLPSSPIFSLQGIYGLEISISLSDLNHLFSYYPTGLLDRQRAQKCYICARPIFLEKQLKIKAQLTNFFGYTFNWVPGQIQNNKALESSNKLRNFLQTRSVKLPFLEVD